MNQYIQLVSEPDIINSMIKNVTDLEVYGESLRLLEKLYAFLKKVPTSEYDTIRQCKKCGKSIPAQIAEGFAKKFYPAEMKRFLMIAIGSSDELVTHLRMLSITVSRLSQEALALGSEYTVLSKRLNSLHTNWGIKYPQISQDH